jgi:hypothetical protein
MKKTIKSMLFILVICWLSSCCKHDNNQSSSGQQPISITARIDLYPNYMDYFILSAKSNYNKKWQIKLISIDDNSATIKSLKTGNVYSAKSNEYFVSQEYGQAGLQLIRISKEKGEIGLYRFASNPKTNSVVSNNSTDGK